MLAMGGVTYSWNIDTGSYSGKSLYYGAQVSAVGFCLGIDGANLYTAGGLSDPTVYQYSLTTPWDVSTGSYSTKSLSTSVIDASPVAPNISINGDNLYFLGAITKTVYQYSLITPWDVSSGIYFGKNYVPAQEPIPNSLAFSFDGTKMYVIGANKTIYEYSLSSAWDVSTASYTTKNLSVSGQSANPAGLCFSIDGTKVYIANTISSSTIYQYNLSTPWDISTGSYSGKSLGTSGTATGLMGVGISIDGSKAYSGGVSNNRVYQYTLT